MRYFIRESFISLSSRNPDLWKKASGCIELFIFQDYQVPDPERVSIGSEKLTEVEITIKGSPFGIRLKASDEIKKGEAVFIDDSGKVVGKIKNIGDEK